ncbi:MAG: hypothetical protein ACYDCS_09175 [Candidatus Dormibacteria bacterium]
MPPSPIIVRAAMRIKIALTADPTLAADERRLAALISEELRIESQLARIPSCLRDDDSWQRT